MKISECRYVFANPVAKFRLRRRSVVVVQPSYSSETRFDEKWKIDSFETQYFILNEKN